MMPIYDYKCPSCGRKEVDVIVPKWDTKYKCVQCHAIMKKLVTSDVRHMTADIFPADGIHLKHVSPEGKTFHSKQEMKDYERKHDVEIDYLH